MKLTKGSKIKSNKGQIWEVKKLGTKNITVVRRFKGTPVAEVEFSIKDLKKSFKLKWK